MNISSGLSSKKQLLNVNVIFEIHLIVCQLIYLSNIYDFCIPFLTFEILTLYTKLSMISLISEEKIIAKRRTNMTADTIIKVVSHMNQMEKNF